MSAQDRNREGTRQVQNGDPLHYRRPEEGGVPYYCALCQFRCTEVKYLKDDLQRYKRHSVIAVQAKVDPMDTSFLKRHAEEIGPKDYLMLSKEESS